MKSTLLKSMTPALLLATVIALAYVFSPPNPQTRDRTVANPAGANPKTEVVMVDVDLVTKPVILPGVG